MSQIQELIISISRKHPKLTQRQLKAAVMDVLRSKFYTEDELDALEMEVEERINTTLNN